MTLAWNLVSKHIRPHDQLQAKIREKICKLEEHLQHFPPETVHLLINLERHAKRDTFSAALTLRVPSNILHSQKESKGDPIPAFDEAMRALMRELKDLKAELRREVAWRRDWRPGEEPLPRPLRFAEKPQAGGPQSLADTLRQMIQRYHGRLLYHVQRELHRDQTDGEVPRGAIKAEVVVDEVVRQALSNPGKKPEEISYRLWLYSLVRRELKRRYRRLREDGERTLSIEESVAPPDEEEPAENYEATRPLGIMAGRLEPPLVVRGDLMADSTNLGPDAVAAEHDLVDYLHTVTATWPEKERAVFDLHFLEGFDPEEVALLEGLKPAQAREMIERVQFLLRGVLSGATGRWIEPDRRGRAGDLRAI